MNDRLENKLSRNIAVTSFLRQFETTWSTNTFMTASVVEIETLIAKVHSLNALQEADARGYALDKEQKRQALLVLGKKVQAGVLAYASSIGDVILLKQVGFSHSSMDLKRDTAIIEVMKLIKDTASGVVASLAPFGVVAATITELGDQIDAFEDVVQKPRTVSAEYSARTKEIVAKMKEIDVELNSKLRYYMLPYRNSSLSFYEGYKKAMMIIDLGHGKSEGSIKVKGKVIDFESGEAMGGVTVAADGLKSDAIITGDDGLFEFGFKTKGTVTLRANKAGYYDGEESVDMDMGNEYEVDIEMEKIAPTPEPPVS